MTDPRRWLEKRWIPVAVAILGILLLIGGGLLSSEKKEEKKETEYAVEYYTEMLEKRVTALCTSVHGVTEATVFLTLESGSEYVYAQNTKGGEAGAHDYVILREGSGEGTVPVTEIYPKVRGIAVVCTGGDTPEIRQILTELLSASMGIPSHRIRVAGR